MIFLHNRYPHEQSPLMDYKCSWCGDDRYNETVPYGPYNGWHGNYCSTRCLDEAQKAGKEADSADIALIASHAQHQEEIRRQTAEQRAENIKKQEEDNEKTGRAMLWAAIFFGIPIPILAFKFVAGWELYAGIGSILLLSLWLRHLGRDDDSGCGCALGFSLLWGGAIYFFRDWLLP